MRMTSPVTILAAAVATSCWSAIRIFSCVHADAACDHQLQLCFVCLRCTGYWPSAQATRPDKRCMQRARGAQTHINNWCLCIQR